MTAMGTATPIPAFAPVESPLEDWEVPKSADDVDVAVMKAPVVLVGLVGLVGRVIGVDVSVVCVESEAVVDFTDVSTEVDVVVESVVAGSVRLKEWEKMLATVPEAVAPVDGSSNQNWLELLRSRSRSSIVQLYDHTPTAMPSKFWPACVYNVCEYWYSAKAHERLQN